MNIIYLIAILTMNVYAHANGCLPESLNRLSGIEQKLIGYSTKVDAFKRKNPQPFPPSREPSSEHIQYCLTGGAQQSSALALQGLDINDELEAFANSQGGACKDAAQKALSNLERMVNDLLVYTKSCN